MGQKRRIYDITNVLEGVGLIEKKNKNIIQWRFGSFYGVLFSLSDFDLPFKVASVKAFGSAVVG